MPHCELLRTTMDRNRHKNLSLNSAQSSENQVIEDSKQKQQDYKMKNTNRMLKHIRTDQKRKESWICCRITRKNDKKKTTTTELNI
jgi:hypothetical protein